MGYIPPPPPGSLAGKEESVWPIIVAFIVLVVFVVWTLGAPAYRSWRDDGFSMQPWLEDK